MVGVIYLYDVGKLAADDAHLPCFNLKGVKKSVIGIVSIRHFRFLFVLIVTLVSDLIARNTSMTWYPYELNYGI